MRVQAGLVFATFLMVAMSARGAGVIAFDNFSCPDSVSLTGVSGFNDNVITCPGSFGGEREDFLLISGGTGSSVSTLSSNPPTGAITGTFGNGIDEFEGMVWGAIPTNPLSLDLVGDSILVQIQSDSGGTVTAGLCTSVTGSCNGGNYSADFSGSSGYQDVYIPLTETPVVLGSGGDLANVNVVDVYVSLNTPGSTWTIDAVEAEAPEPSTLLLLNIGMLLGVRLRQEANSR